MGVSIFRKGVWQGYKLPHVLPVLLYSSSTRRNDAAPEGISVSHAQRIG